jgi:hypothetical protein
MSRRPGKPYETVLVSSGIMDCRVKPGNDGAAD